MAGTNVHNWPRLYKRAADLIRSGKAKPQWRDLARHLGVSRTTLTSGFAREFGLQSSDLAGLPDRKLPSDKTTSGKTTLPQHYHNIMPEEVKKALDSKPLTLYELADALDRGTSIVEISINAMIDDGFEFARKDLHYHSTYLPQPTLPTLWDRKSKRICFGIGSDIHFGSKFAQISAFKKFIEIGISEYNVTNFLWAGDITAGIGMYRGQHNDLYAHSAEDQAESCIRTFPQNDGVKHIMIGGNHDYSFMRQNGYNIVKSVCDKRSDFTYAGFDYADIPLIDNDDGVTIASAILWHPSGGVPYALSYRGQKMAAEVSREELAEVVTENKPAPTVRFIFWGHLHVSDIFPHGPIWVIGPGCFEGTSGYLKQKGLRPVIQGLIIEADLTDNGLIAAVHIHPIPFMEKDDDYKSAWVPEMARASQRIEPLFSIMEDENEN